MTLLHRPMPIRPENRDCYGPDWPAFSRRIRFVRAAGRCECVGECGRGHVGRCPNQHGAPAYGTGSRVVLTVAHLTHEPEDRKYVRAMCQGCHLHYDRAHHAETRRCTRDQRSGQLSLALAKPARAEREKPLERRTGDRVSVAVRFLAPGAGSLAARGVCRAALLASSPPNCTGLLPFGVSRKRLRGQPRAVLFHPALV